MRVCIVSLFVACALACVAALADQPQTTEQVGAANQVIRSSD